MDSRMFFVHELLCRPCRVLQLLASVLDHHAVVGAPYNRQSKTLRPLTLAGKQAMRMTSPPTDAAQTMMAAGADPMAPVW
jgi:hypothetical protein